MTNKFSINNTKKVAETLSKRHQAEKRLKYYGLFSVTLGISFLVILISSIFINGYTAFQQTHVLVNLTVDSEYILDANGNVSEELLYSTNWDGIVKKNFRTQFPEVTERFEKRKLSEILSANAGYDLRKMILDDITLVGKNISVWVKSSDDVDQFMKGRMNVDVPEGENHGN